MKKYIVLFIGLFCLPLSALFAQLKGDELKEIVAQRKFIFVARSAMAQSSTEISKILGSMGGGSQSSNISLSGSGYTLSIDSNEVIAYLPYYGRAYIVSMPNATEGGIKFSSKDFTFTIKDKGKKGYSIQINTADVKSDQYRMYLDIGLSGYATLQVNSNNRQSITYNGVIEKIAAGKP